MNISSIKPDQLSDAQLNAWRQIVESDATYDSPFYHPDFTMAVAQARSDVEVAVLQEADGSFAFLPLQRMSSRVARPVGWKLNDFQGVIAPSNMSIDPAEVLKACRLSQWRFDHLPVSQQWCKESHHIPSTSPAIDLRGGFDAYLAAKKVAGDSRLKTTMRKARKMEREVGALRLEFHCTNPGTFATLIDWKSEQLRRTKKPNALVSEWASKTLERLRSGNSIGCRGALSALYSGDALVAAHFGLHNDRVLHWWITAYNPKFEQYSAGAVLLLKVLQACAERGIYRVDLGKGDEPYKRHFMTGAIPIAEGAIAAAPWQQAQQRIAFRLKDSIRNSAWLRPAVHWMKRMQHDLAGN